MIHTNVSHMPVMFTFSSTEYFIHNYGCKIFKESSNIHEFLDFIIQAKHKIQIIQILMKHLTLYVHGLTMWNMAV